MLMWLRSDPIVRIVVINRLRSRLAECAAHSIVGVDFTSSAESRLHSYRLVAPQIVHI